MNDLKNHFFWPDKKGGLLDELIVNMTFLAVRHVYKLEDTNIQMHRRLLGNEVVK